MFYILRAVAFYAASREIILFSRSLVCESSEIVVSTFNGKVSKRRKFWYYSFCAGTYGGRVSTIYIWCLIAAAYGRYTVRSTAGFRFRSRFRFLSIPVRLPARPPSAGAQQHPPPPPDRRVRIRLTPARASARRRRPVRVAAVPHSYAKTYFCRLARVASGYIAAPVVLIA